MANYHVSKNKELDKWQAQRENARHVSGFYKNEAQAEKAAKLFSKNTGGGEVRIHGLNGKIRDSDTVPPGHDPHHVKDKKH